MNAPSSSSSAHPRLHRLLSARWLPVVAALAAAMLVSGSLRNGWLIDDHYQRAGLTGKLPPGQNFDSAAMFAFIDGDPERNLAFKKLGGLPWWAHDELRLSFWRPLSGWTHALDYAPWPENAVAMHAQNLLWLVALILAASSLYRQAVGPGAAAGLAALLYALDDAHAMPAGWIANRNALVAAFFGVVAIQWHLRWRRDDWKPGALLSPLALACALLAGESGAGALAYLFAASLFLDRRKDFAGKAAGLIPHAVVAGAWLVALRAQGHGSAWSDFYVDPVGEPVRFAGAMAERAPLLLMGLFGFPPTDIASALAPSLQIPLRAWAFGLSLAALWAFAPRIKRDPSARFFALGMALSLVPISATLPSDRLLFFAGLGGFGLLSLFLSDAFSIAPANEATPARRQAKFGRRAETTLAWLFLATHLLVAPLSTPIRANDAKNIGDWMVKVADSLGDDPAWGEKRAIIVNPPATFFIAAAPVELMLRGKPFPRGIATLAPGIGAVEVRRVDERTIAVAPEFGWLAPPSERDGPIAFSHLARRFETLYRSRSAPAPLGYSIDLGDYAVEITALTSDGRPAEATFRFAEPLESDAYAWLAWDEAANATRPFVPPAPGETTTLPAYAAPIAVLTGS